MSQRAFEPTFWNVSKRPCRTQDLKLTSQPCAKAPIENAWASRLAHSPMQLRQHALLPTHSDPMSRVSKYLSCQGPAQKRNHTTSALTPSLFSRSGHMQSAKSISRQMQREKGGTLSFLFLKFLDEFPSHQLARFSKSCRISASLVHFSREGPRRL